MDDGVELCDVRFSYGRRRVLDGIDLSFGAGQVAAIVGPNGCGKSTTVRLICRALEATSGTVRVCGRDVRSLGRKALARRVAVLSQGGRVPNMQVEQLVMGGRYPYRPALCAPTAGDRSIVREAMERAGCARFAAADVARLSGGERQRVYLAMVLAQQADVVIMDEPTTYLDAAACFDLMGMARELADGGTTVVMVLHDLCLALASCDRVAVMAQGKVQAQGEPSRVVADGAIERVFGVRLRSVEEGAKTHYCLLPG